MQSTNKPETESRTTWRSKLKLYSEYTSEHFARWIQQSLVSFYEARLKYFVKWTSYTAVVPAIQLRIMITITRDNVLRNSVVPAIRLQNMTTLLRTSHTVYSSTCHLSTEYYYNTSHIVYSSSTCYPSTKNMTTILRTMYKQYLVPIYEIWLQHLSVVVPSILEGSQHNTCRFSMRSHQPMLVSQ